MPFGAVEMDGERQRIFLVRAAAALAPQRDGEFAARKDGDAPALGGVVAGEPGMFGGDLARFALQAVAEHHAFVAGVAGAGLGGGKRVGRPRDDPVVGPGESRVARLRRFVGRIVERARHGLRQFEAVFGDDRARIGERRRIGHRRSGTDDRGVVAGHVGNRERDHFRRMGALREPAAFDAREMFADAVDLADIGAAAQQRPRRRLLLGEA